MEKTVTGKAEWGGCHTSPPRLSLASLFSHHVSFSLSDGAKLDAHYVYFFSIVYDIVDRRGLIVKNFLGFSEGVRDERRIPWALYPNFIRDTEKTLYN